MQCIVSGALAGAPIEKTAKSGSTYLIAKIVERNGDRKRWISCFVFSAEACGEIRRLDDGDPIAVAGEIDADVYAPEGGEARVNWRITADSVISARKPAAKAKAAGKSREKANGRDLAGSSWAAPTAAAGTSKRGELDDAIPF